MLVIGFTLLDGSVGLVIGLPGIPRLSMMFESPGNGVL
jgi:hypothetical protein